MTVLDRVVVYGYSMVMDIVWEDHGMLDSMVVYDHIMVDSMMVYNHSTLDSVVCQFIIISMVLQFMVYGQCLLDSSMTIV